MAGKDIEIGIASETKAFKQGVDAGIIKPVEDATEALEKMGKSRGPEQLEDGFKEAQKASEKLETEVKETAATIERKFKDSYRQIDDGAQQGFSKAGDAARSFKEEAISNLSEVTSSFDGSMQGIADGIQGTLGGAALGLAGISLPAALAAGVLGAVFGSVLTAIGDDSDEAKAKVSALTQELIETGTIGPVSLGYVVDALKELASTTEDGEVSLKKLREVAENSRSSFKDLAQAYSGSSDDLDKLVKSNQDLYDSLVAQAEAIDTTTTAGVEQYSELEKRLAAQDAYNGYLREAQTVAHDAAQAAADFAAAGGPEMERKADLIEGINSAYDDAAGAVQDFIDKETGVFDVQAYIDAMQARADALNNYQQNLATSGLSSEAKAGLNSLGAEQAAAVLAGYLTATPAQKAALEAVWAEMAEDNSGTYVDTMNDKFATPVKGPLVVADRLDLSGPEAQLNEFVTRGRSVRITADVYSRTGEKLY